MFYETAQTIGPGWHGKTFRPSHYDDMSWTSPSSASRHFRSPGSSPTIRRRVINYDDNDDDPEPRMFQRRSPTFERKFFKDVWNDHPRREDMFEDRPRMFKRTVSRDWDKEVEDFENSVRQSDRDFRDAYEEPEGDEYDGSEPGSGRVRHIPILVERRRNRMNDGKSYNTRCSPPPPPPSLEQEEFVDESDEWLRHHMNRLKQNFDSGFSTLQNRHIRHRLPKVDLNCRPRAFTTPIPDWGPENSHTLPTRKLHSRVNLDDKRNPKSVFRSYSETHEDIPREHPTASRSHSDSHCPKTAYITKVSVNIPSEKAEDTPKTEEGRPEPPQRRSRHRAKKEENNNTATEQEHCQDKKKMDDKSKVDEQSVPKTKVDESSEDVPKTNDDSKTRKNSLRNERGASALLQISSVLQNVEDLLHHVEAYNGNGRDKQFRFLDEMLTRCMLRLDDVDTDGLDDVRNARKAAVRKVQACIEKLESRATEDKEKTTSSSNNSSEGSENETKPEESDPSEDPCPQETPPPNTEEVEQTKL